MKMKDGAGGSKPNYRMYSRQGFRWKLLHPGFSGHLSICRFTLSVDFSVRPGSSLFPPL